MPKSKHRPKHKEALKRHRREFVAGLTAAGEAQIKSMLERLQFEEVTRKNIMANIERANATKEYFEAWPGVSCDLEREED